MDRRLKVNPVTLPEALAAALARGVPFAVIAEDLDISIKTVSRWCRVYGLMPCPPNAQIRIERRHGAQVLSEVERLLRAGETLSAIGRAVGVSHTQVWHWRKRFFAHIPWPRTRNKEHAVIAF